MRTCRECHFLSKVAIRSGHELLWDDNERADGYIRMDAYVPECHKKVWSMRLDPMLAYANEIQENRRKCRFFYPYSRGMSYPSASELLEIERTNRRNKITIIGIVISALIGFVGWFL